MAETQTDWRTMTPGSDLNVLVAERVLNQTPICIEGCWKWRRDGEGSFFRLPEFSFQMGAAWELVEAMEKRGWEWILTKENGRYSASFQHVERDIWPDDTWADTAPLAICRAALAALEVPQ